MDTTTYHGPSRRYLKARWRPILDHPNYPAIVENHKREATAILLENQNNLMKTPEHRFIMRQLNEDTGGPDFLTEAHANAGADGIPLGGEAGQNTGGVAGYDPILISLVRRAMPQLIAYDICGVQPMTQPTGLIFAFKSRYTSQGGREALFGEADPSFSADGSSVGGLARPATGATTPGDLLTADPRKLSPGVSQVDPTAGNYDTAHGITTAQAELRGFPGQTPFPEMAFTIEKTSVTARSRLLKAEYTHELAQDLKSVHGLDAEGELSNILTHEIMAEINREVVRTIYRAAKPGAQNNTVNPGVFDMDVDSGGRWMLEKFKGLIFQIERDANAIGHETRRGRGNFVIVSADVASALTLSGVLDYAPAMNVNLSVDDTNSTFAGVLNGRFKVYVDPYAANISDDHFYCLGYKGPSAYDAGIFYCPYVPLQMVRAMDPDGLQPKIGFRTRYGLVANPFVELDDATPQGQYLDGNSAQRIGMNQNYYYRIAKVEHLL